MNPAMWFTNICSFQMTVYHIDLNRIILYHIDIKIQKERKHIPFIVINNMKHIQLYVKVS